MLRDGSVGTNPVLVHERDEVRFGEQRRPGRLAVAQLAHGWHELSALFKIRDVAVAPLVVRVDLKVVPGEHGQAGREELLAAARDLDGCLPPLRVLGAARQKSPGDELVYTLLVASEITTVRRWVDGWMRLVVLLSSSRSRKPAVLQRSGKSTPCGIDFLFVDERHKVELWIELVRFCSWVRQETFLI